MESQNQLLLNSRREFGDVIGDGIKMMKINIKSILSVFLSIIVPMILLPIVLLMFSSGMKDYLGIFSGNISPSLFQSSSVILVVVMIMLVYFLAFICLNLIVFATSMAYEESGNQVVTSDQIKEQMKKYFGNYLVSFFVLVGVFLFSYILLILMFFISSILGGLFAFLWFFAFIWFMNVMQNFSYIRIREGLDVGDAFTRAFQLSKENWWSMFGILIVASMISSIAAFVFSIPFRLITTFGALSAIESESTMMTVIMIGASFFIYMIGNLFLQQYVSFCSILKYYDLVEQKDGSSVAAQIDQLGESGDSFFENEGEY